MHDTPAHEAAALCTNCGAPLTGPYCAQCGQHVHDSSRSIGVVLHDAWHVIAHVDGRLWLTLKTLLLRPGQLSLEYFAGRRARYVPPFQLYFIVSLVLFGLPAVISHFGIPEAAERPNATHVEPSDCASIAADPPWLDRMVKDACRRHAGDQGRALSREFNAAVPRMMFLFLPLMAAVMMLLYLKQRRNYVEHLVYFLHVHAALFVLLVLNMLIGTLAGLVPALHWLPALVSIVLTLYGARYVYRSMRSFYGQGRGTTLLKLIIVSLAYLVFLAATLLSTLLITALFA